MRDPGLIKRSPRVATRHAALLTDARGTVSCVVVTDISKGGFRLSTEETVRIGERVELSVPKYGSFPALIRWSLGTEAGGIFLQTVSLT